MCQLSLIKKKGLQEDKCEKNTGKQKLGRKTRRHMMEKYGTNEIQLNWRKKGKLLIVNSCRLEHENKESTDWNDKGQNLWAKSQTNEVLINAKYI